MSAKVGKQYSKLSSTTNEENSITVSICGSYHRHLKEIGERIAECRQLGITVLIPKYATPKSEKNGFVILRGERGTPRELQDKNFAAIERSSFVLIQDTNGYIGPSTALEIGYAYAKGIPVFCTEKPREYIFTLYTTFGKSLAEIKSILRDNHPETERANLEDLAVEAVTR